jgi:hypothetical protein
MARLGRGFPQRTRILGIPPAEAPGPAPDRAPVAGGTFQTSGGRHGRATPTRPLTQISPRPIAVVGGGDLTITVTAGSATYSAAAPTVSVAYTALPADGTWSAPAPLVRATIGAASASQTSSAAAPAVSITIGAAPATVTYSAPTPTISVPLTITVEAALATYSAAAPAFSTRSAAQGGGSRTEYDGETLAIRAHLERIGALERQRDDDEALVLLMCA